MYTLDMETVDCRTLDKKLVDCCTSAHTHSNIIIQESTVNLAV